MLIRLSAACLLATVVLGVPPAAAQSIPVLNVEQTCRDIPAGTAFQRDAAACMRSEDEARATLAKEWSQFSAGDRSFCTQTATMGGTASYVELLTCLEMQRDVRSLPRDELTRIRQPVKR